MKAILVLLAVVCAASCEKPSESDISQKLTPPNQDDSSNIWQEHSDYKSSTTDASRKSTKDSYQPTDDGEIEIMKVKSSTTETSRKSTKDSYEPIDDDELEIPKMKSTTSKSFVKKTGNPEKSSKLDPIPESDDNVENFEESAQSYYGGYGGGYGRGYGGYGGGYGGRYAYPSYGFNNYRRPYRPFGGYGYGR